MKEGKNILIFDLGSTHLKICVMSPSLHILFERHQKNIRISTEYYEALDTENIEKFIFEAIRDCVDHYHIEDIIISTHGSALALVHDDDTEKFNPFDNHLSLPVMFYGQDIPASIQEAYKKQAPLFSETYAETSPLALTGALQLFWLSQAWKKPFNQTQKIMMWASYWSFRLSGVACNDFSSLGAQNQLWDPNLNDFSSVVKKHGWDKLIVPPRPSFDKIGILHPEIRQKYGLKNKPNILCGTHDSNANYWRFIKMGFKDAVIVSTGTWIIGFNPNLAPKKLEGKPDCCTNVNAQGKTISCSRYQGGLEFSILLEKMGNIPLDTEVKNTDMQHALQSGCMIMPSFASSGGPIAHSEKKGAIIGNLPDDHKQKYALITLYSAFMTQTSLEYIEAGKYIIIDGPFINNPLFLQIMAILNPDADIYISQETNGTLLGAALLSDQAYFSKTPHLQKVHILPEYEKLKTEIQAYKTAWQKMVINVSFNPNVPKRAV